MNALAERALGPVEGMRRALLQQLLRAPALRRLLVRREARVPLLLSVYASIAFGVAMLAPSWTLLLSPLVLGVPHVAADVRHLLLRRGLPRAWCALIAGFACAMVALRLVRELAVVRADLLAVEHALGSLWLLVAGVGGAAASRRPVRCLAAAAVALGIGFFAVCFPRIFGAGLVHAHNLIALAIWFVLFRRSARLAWLPIIVVLGGALVLASGVLLPFTLQHGTLALLGVHLFEVADWIAPGLNGLPAISLTVCFAFLQAVHYAIWLVAIPQDDSRAAGPPTYPMKLRALTRDFGHVGLWIIVGAMLLVAAGAVRAPIGARNLYLSLATFHVWLELALFAYLLARRDTRSRAAAP